MTETTGPQAYKVDSYVWRVSAIVKGVVVNIYQESRGRLFKQDPSFERLGEPRGERVSRGITSTDDIDVYRRVAGSDGAKDRVINMLELEHEAVPVYMPCIPVKCHVSKASGIVTPLHRLADNQKKASNPPSWNVLDTWAVAALTEDETCTMLATIAYDVEEGEAGLGEERIEPIEPLVVDADIDDSEDEAIPHRRVMNVLMPTERPPLVHTDGIVEAKTTPLVVIASPDKRLKTVEVIVNIPVAPEKMNASWIERDLIDRKNKQREEREHKFVYSSDNKKKFVYNSIMMAEQEGTPLHCILYCTVPSYTHTRIHSYTHTLIHSYTHTLINS